MSGAETRLLVRKALYELPVDQRLAVIAVDMEGFTVAEAAARLGVPVETIRNWEQGKRQPRGPARALLKLLDEAPVAGEHAGVVGGEAAGNALDELVVAEDVEVLTLEDGSPLVHDQFGTNRVHEWSLGGEDVEDRDGLGRGVAGVGETLRRLPRKMVRVRDAALETDLDAMALSRLTRAETQ